MSIAFRFKDLVLPTLFCLLLSGAWGQPKISSFSPTSGPVGSTVTISGTNFSPTVANNMVYFGQIRASVNSASSSSLVVTVPSGASFQPITVTTGGLTAYSRNPFVVTFPGASLVFSTQSFAYVTKLDSIDGLSETTKYTVGDLDGDGKMDVVTLDRLNNTLAVYRNVTNGGMIEFTSRLDFPTGQTPRSATIADLDGDGRADIAVSDFSDNTVSILRNTTVGGNLSFAGRVDFPTFTQPGAIAVADVDGDGRPDLVVNTINMNGIVSVLRNTGSVGSVSFAPKVDLTTLSGSIEELRTSDVDGDGRPDIIIPAYSLGKLEVLRNTCTNGTVSFSTPYLFDGFAYPDGVEVGDFNLDGKPDVAMTTYLGNFVLIYQNTGTPGNPSFQFPVYFSAGNGGTNGMSISDMDGDGLPDLAVGSSAGGNISLHKNLTTGGSISFSAGVPLSTFFSSHPICADMDNDGRPDLAINGSMFRAVIWRNRVTGPQIQTFTPVTGREGDTIHIQGDNFVDVQAIRFGGVAAASYTVNDPTRITAIVGSGGTGEVRVVSTTDSTGLAGFQFKGPPVIQLFSPAATGPNEVITIKGLNLGSVTDVSIAGTSVPFTILDDFTIQTSVGQGASGDISVTNPFGTASRSGYIYLPKPFMNSFSPTSGVSGTTVTITGYNFDGVTGVSFGGVPATSFTVVNGSTLQAMVGSGGSGPVKVTNATGSVEQPGFKFFPAPTLLSFSPAEAASGDTLTIKGSNIPVYYNGGSVNTVTIGGVQVFSFWVPDSNTIKLIVPFAASGAVSISTNRGDASLPGFTFIYPPVITGITPLIISAGSEVTITGQHLSRAIGVNFGGIPSASFMVASDSIIRAVAGNGNSGSVSVSTPRHTVSAGAVTFRTAPFIYAISPSSGPAGTTMTIRGINFKAGAGNELVYFGGVRAKVVSATEHTIEVIVPSGANYKPITVVNQSNGLSAVSDQRFTVTFSGDPSAFNDSSFAGNLDLGTGSSPLFLKQADMDGDGRPDIVVANQASTFLTVYRNISVPGRLSFAPRTDVEVGMMVRGMAIADLDGDGMQDLVLSNDGIAPKIHVFRNQGQPGKFIFSKTCTIGDFQYDLGYLETADLDLDGRPDIVAMCADCAGPAAIEMCLNTGSGASMAFNSPIRFGYPSNGSVSGIMSGLGIADYDHDGWPDVFAGMFRSSSLYGFRNYGLPSSGPIFDVRVFDNYGGYAGFSTLRPLSATFTSAEYPDLVAGNFIYHNVGGNLTEFSRNYFNASAVNDLNGDGKLDVMGTDINTGDLSIMKNSGDSAHPIAFFPSVSLHRPGSVFVDVGDLDGDAKPEICLTYRGSNLLRILRNRIGEPQPPRPRLSTFSPDTASNGMQVIITGADLSQTSSVTFGGVSAACFSILSSDTIMATLGAGASGSIVVTTPGGSDSLSGFVYMASPVVAKFAPDAGVAGTTVHISGSHFDQVTQVSFGGVPASSFQVISSDSIVAVVGNGETGAVSVSAKYGSGSLDGFTFHRQPKINGFTPKESVSGGQVVLFGENFYGVSQVTFGGVPAGSFQIAPNGQGIVATIGSGASGNVMIQNLAGVDSMAGFIYLFPPAIGSFSPTTAAKGTVVTIKGKFPLSVQSVSFGGTDASSFTVVDSLTITAVVGTGSSGSIVVKTAAGESSLGGFTFSTVTGINDPAAANVKDLTVTPNPAHDRILIRYPASLKASSLRIVDLTGHTVKVIIPPRNSTRTEVQMEDLRAGPYIVIWTDGMKRYSRVLEVY